jgi:hypothetical protein
MTECMLGRAIPARRILPKAVKAFRRVDRSHRRIPDCHRGCTSLAWFFTRADPTALTRVHDLAHLKATLVSVTIAVPAGQNLRIVTTSFR